MFFIISAIIGDVNIVAEQKKHIGNAICLFFISFSTKKVEGNGALPLFWRPWLTHLADG